MSGVGGGLSSLTVLASGLANIFSKQIGAGIAGMIQNKEVARNNKAADELKYAIAQDYQLQGDKNATADSAKVKAEADIAERILNIKSQLTQEEYEQLMAIQKRRGYQAEQLQLLQNYKKVAKEILGNEEATVKDFQEEVAARRQALKLAEEENKITTKNLKSKIGSYNKDTSVDGRSLKGLRNELTDLSESITTHGPDRQLINEAILKIRNKEKITEEEISAILKAQNDSLNQQRYEMEQVEQGAVERAEAEEIALSEQADEAAMQAIERQKARQEAIQNTVQTLTSLVFVMTSLSGVVKTIADPDLTG